MAELFRFETRAMASPLRLSIHGLPAASAESAWAEVRDEFEASEQAMSRFRETSEVTALNRACADGRFARVSPRLRHALVASDRAWRITGGRFDARLLRDLDRLGYRGVPIDGADRPAPEGPEGHGGRPDGRLLECAPDGGVRLTAPVDLGGIGKGLALRWAAARVHGRLGEEGGALLEAGGDLVALGASPDAGSWLVGVEDPSGGEAPVAAIAVLDSAVATSSVAVHSWVGPSGEHAHHLLDPATGEPGRTGLAAVTVLGSDPAWAEVRTKQLFLAGRDGIGPLARSLGLAAWWVTADGDLAMTPGARVTTVWTAPGRGA